MKLTRTTLLLLLWFVSQQVFALLPHMPASQHGSQHTLQQNSVHNSVAHVDHSIHSNHGMHDGASHMSHSGKQDCCEKTCNCSLSHCASAAITTAWNPYLFVQEITEDHYAFSDLSIPPDYYLRPPISY